MMLQNYAKLTEKVIKVKLYNMWQYYYFTAGFPISKQHQLGNIQQQRKVERNNNEF